jgi:aryl-alcohol dehydrogenase-like predicted oxidoreductase
LHREAAAELFPKALAKGVGIFVAEPLAKGFLSGKYTKSSVFPAGDIRHHWPVKHQSSLVNQVEGFQKAVQDVPFTLAQSAIRFVLAQPMVSSVVVGCKTTEQVQENLLASELVLQLV